VVAAMGQQVQQHFLDRQLAEVTIGEAKGDHSPQFFAGGALSEVDEPGIVLRDAGFELHEFRRLAGVVSDVALRLTTQTTDKQAVDHRGVIEDADKELRVVLGKLF